VIPVDPQELDWFRPASSQICGFRNHDIDILSQIGSSDVAVEFRMMIHIDRSDRSPGVVGLLRHREGQNGRADARADLDDLAPILQSVGNAEEELGFGRTALKMWLYPAFPNLYLHSEPVCIGCQVFS